MPRLKFTKPHVVIYETEYEWCGDEGDMTAEGDYENAYRKVVSCIPDRWDREDGVIDALCNAWGAGVAETFQTECERLLRASLA